MPLTEKQTNALLAGLEANLANVTALIALFTAKASASATPAEVKAIQDAVDKHQAYRDALKELSRDGGDG
jgi:hypothetical protein